MVLLFLPLLPSPTLANIYDAPNKPTWLPVAHWLGLRLYAVQPSFGERPSQKYIHTGGLSIPPPKTGGSAPFPIPTYHHLPIPYLGDAKGVGVASTKGSAPFPIPTYHHLPIPYLGDAKGVGVAWWHPDKIPSSSRKPRVDQTHLLTT